jgi:hypothetical protein
VDKRINDLLEKTPRIIFGEAFGDSLRKSFKKLLV